MNIYVGNVPYAATETDLEELFEPHGPLESVTIIRDRYDGRSKGYGFVEMESQEDGERAIEALDGQEMMGRPLKVNPARPRGERERKRPEHHDRQQNGHSEGTVSTDNQHDYFHNPYTFVPTPSRKKAIKNKGFAGDFNPLKHLSGQEYNLDHATLKDGLWTGHIPIKLTTVTPLVLLKDDGRERKATEHQKYDVYDRIPESSLRGMLRSAYETVTNSRYSSFRNSDRLAYRMETDKAVELIPAIVRNGEICLYPGLSKVTSEGPKGNSNKPQPYAAMLTMYAANNLKTINDTNYTPRTGDKVWAEILLCQHKVSNRGRNDWTNDFLFWKVVKVWKREKDSNEPQFTNKSIYHKSRPKTYKQYKQSHYTPLNPEDRRMVKGHVMITNRNMGNKHDERIFFNPHSEKFEVTEDLKESWRMRIQSYRDAHSKSDIFKRNGAIDEPWKYLGKQPGKTAWSPHQYQDNSHRDVWRKDPHGRTTKHDALELKDGDMVYARCDIGNTGTIKAIKELFPVMISRELYENSPKDLLDPSLLPATTRNEMSPADRLFGWTPQGESNDSGYKSRIRVVCEDGEDPDVLEKFENDPLPLTILGEPKPEQGRFYVAADDKGTPQNRVQNKKDAGYDKKSNKPLRGRKQYWHHKGLEPKNAPNYWKSPVEDRTQKKTNERFQEYRRPDKHDNQTQQMRKQTDTQNRSIKGWIKPNTQCTASLYVQNLQPTEVGALLWLLTLNKDLKEGNNKHYFRLGYGKPLGFGSVTIEIDEDRFKGCLPLGTGEDWKKYYEDLNACPPATLDTSGRKNCIQEFQNSMKQVYQGQDFNKLPFIEGFLQVLQGPNTDNPRIHYPRSKPERAPEGKNYEWFMENERGNKYKDGKQLALPDVNNDQGLPYTPSDLKGKK